MNDWTHCSYLARACSERGLPRARLAVDQHLAVRLKFPNRCDGDAGELCWYAWRDDSAANCSLLDRWRGHHFASPCIMKSAMMFRTCSRSISTRMGSSSGAVNARSFSNLVMAACSSSSSVMRGGDVMRYVPLSEYVP